MRTFGLFLLVMQFIGVAFAYVPPEIPGDRTFQRFSPFHFAFHDMGEATLQADLQKLKYALSGYYSNDTTPSEPNPDDLGITNPSYAGLTAFADIVESESGVLFWATHGGSSNRPALARRLTPHQQAGGKYLPCFTKNRPVFGRLMSIAPDAARP